MSSEKGGKNPPHRKPKVSWATLVDPGEVGPKPRRGAQAKDNRRTFLYCMYLPEDGATQKESRARGWKSASKAVGRLGRQIPPGKKPRTDRPLTPSGESGTGRTTLPRKASNESTCTRTKTDTGRRGENPKVRGKTPVKELGKMHP